MQKKFQIYPGLLKLSRKRESVTDGQTAAITISRGDQNICRRKNNKIIDKILILDTELFDLVNSICY